LFGIAITLTGIVCADQVVNATPETQTLTTVTTGDVVGLVMETGAGTWTLTDDPLTLYTYNNATPFGYPDTTFNLLQAQLQFVGGSITGIPDGAGNMYITQINVPKSLLNVMMPVGASTWQQFLNIFAGSFNGPVIMGKGIHTGALDPGQVQYTTAYDANIVAQAGHTVLTKSMNIDTRNKVISQSNVNAKTGLTFIATADGGNVIGSENLMLDGAGDTTRASDRILCPFVPLKEGNVIPAYCNIVQVGSKYDLT
jgi:hypothetical protein